MNKNDGAAKTFKVKRILWVLVFGPALGCQKSGVSFGDEDSRSKTSPIVTLSESSQTSSGNGTPYDGKLQVFVEIDRNECEKLGKIDENVLTQITYSQTEQEYRLTRENCSEVTSQVLLPSQILQSQTLPGSIVYESRFLEPLAPLANLAELPATNAVLCRRDQEEVVELAVTRAPTGEILAHVFSSAASISATDILIPSFTQLPNLLNGISEGSGLSFTVDYTSGLANWVYNSEAGNMSVSNATCAGELE